MSLIKIPVFLFLFLTFNGGAIAETKLIQVIVDNSGLLHDEKDFKEKKTFDVFTANFLKKLAKNHRRERSYTTILISSSTEKPRSVWKGSASDFFRKGVNSEDIKNLFSHKVGCNDIPTALEDAVISKSIDMAEKNVLYIITSGVHSGPNCEDLTQEKYVDLLEKMDLKLDKKLKEVANEFDVLSVQFLTASQRRLFFGSLSDTKFNRNVVSQGQEPIIYDID